jgi:hypothetical protein
VPESPQNRAPIMARPMPFHCFSSILPSMTNTFTICIIIAKRPQPLQYAEMKPLTLNYRYI